MSTSSTSRGALALDLDGTLIDPRPRQVAALAALLASEEGIGQLNRDRFWELKRAGLTTAGALVDLGVDPATAERVADRWVATVEDSRWLDLDRMIPGVPRALDSLQGGARPLILTARQHEDRVRDQVSSLGLLHWCAEVTVVSPDSAAEAKAAQLLMHGCRGLVGDTESDAKAAEIAGVDFAAVSTGQRSEQYLRARGLATFDSLGGALRALGI